MEILKRQIELIQNSHISLSDERLAELLVDQLREKGTDVLYAKILEEAILRAKYLRKPD